MSGARPGSEGGYVVVQIVVLAGGLGTRLRSSLAEGTPKPMALIRNRPFLEFVLDWALGEGADDIVLLLGFGANAIRDHFGDAYRSVPIRYSMEHRPLGTGGALKAASEILEEEFVLINGDTYVEVSYSDLLEQTRQSAVVFALTHVADVTRFGRVLINGNTVVGFDEKGASGQGLINAGVYGCRKDLLKMMPAEEVFSLENDLLVKRLEDLKPAFVRTAPLFIDIGIPEDYRLAQGVLS